MRVLVFEDSEVLDVFDYRGLVRSTGRHHEGGDFLAVCVEFYFLLGLGSTCIAVFEDNKRARHLGVRVEFETPRY